MSRSCASLWPCACGREVGSAHSNVATMCCAAGLCAHQQLALLDRLGSVLRPPAGHHMRGEGAPHIPAVSQGAMGLCLLRASNPVPEACRTLAGSYILLSSSCTYSTRALMHHPSSSPCALHCRNMILLAAFTVVEAFLVGMISAYWNIGKCACAWLPVACMQSYLPQLETRPAS